MAHLMRNQAANGVEFDLQIAVRVGAQVHAKAALQSGPLAGLTARSVVVLDEHNQVLYSELVPEIAQEPDYNSALAAL